jgi:hypothetical protein
MVSAPIHSVGAGMSSPWQQPRATAGMPAASAAFAVALARAAIGPPSKAAVSKVTAQRTILLD